MAGEKKPAKRGQGREEQIFIFGISWCGAVFVFLNASCHAAYDSASRLIVLH